MMARRQLKFVLPVHDNIAGAEAAAAASVGLRLISAPRAFPFRADVVVVRSPSAVASGARFRDTDTKGRTDGRRGYFAREKCRWERGNCGFVSYTLELRFYLIHYINLKSILYGLFEG